MRVEYDAAEDLRPSHIAQDDSTPNLDFSTSPSTSTKDTNVVAFNVQRTDDGSCDAHMYTPKTDSEDEPGGVDEGLRRYNDMLATL